MINALKPRIFLALVLTLMSSISAHAQKPDIRESFEVNGIKMGDVVNDSIIRSKLGRPTREGIIDGMYGYWFGDTFVGIGIGDNKVYSIAVRDSRFPVMTNTFEGGIRVGDDANKVKSKIRQETRNEIREFDGGFLAGDYEFHICFDVSNGVIISISQYFE